MRPLQAFCVALSFALSVTGTQAFHSERSSNAHHRAIAKQQQLQGRGSLPEARFGLGSTRPIRGVNLGNWLITESWMEPNFYFKAQNGNTALRDEKSWILAHSNRQQAYDTLRQHYSSYLTEADFRLMNSYGINSVRIPVPYWLLEDAAPSSDEVYLFKGGRPQLRQALLWCKKYNIDVMLDLHAAPGSQNAYDNSGSRAGVFWQTKQSYYDRTITALETMVDFYVNNASYGGIVKSILVLNEPLVGSDKWIPLSLLQKFYIQSYRAIRARVSSSKGAQVMPTIYFSNSIIGTDPWMEWFPSRFNDGTFVKGTIGLEVHRYQSFKPLDQLSYDEHITRACHEGIRLAQVQSVLPVIVGEMSDGVSLRCVDYRTCVGRTMLQDINTLNTKASNYFSRRFWEAQRVTYETSAAGWYFWSWKSVCASQWSYRDAVQQVWLPANPSERVFFPNSSEVAAGQCVSRKPNHSLQFRTTST